jgi:transposase
VNYLHSGVPIYSHAESDLKHFRYITSKFILEGLCTRREISNCFGVSYDSVKRYTKRLETKGYQFFFNHDNRQGSCYKLLPAVITRMQKNLDAGMSNSEIARIENVTEGAVRYAIKTGKLKKKNHY